MCGGCTTAVGVGLGLRGGGGGTLNPCSLTTSACARIRTKAPHVEEAKKTFNVESKRGT